MKWFGLGGLLVLVAAYWYGNAKYKNACGAVIDPKGCNPDVPDSLLAAIGIMPSGANQWAEKWRNA